MNNKNLHSPLEKKKLFTVSKPSRWKEEENPIPIKKYMCKTLKGQSQEKVDDVRV
jgi:hypothetical protein